MDHLKQFARRMFAEETENVTGGAVEWRSLPELPIEEVKPDRLVVIRRPHLLAHLAAPWPEAQPHAELMLELKLAGSRLDRLEVERALLRQQARLLQRLDEEDASWLGEEPLWLVASHVPGWVEEKYRPERFAPGCYCVEPQGRTFLWIAANELPLLDELLPFLVARSGPALDELVRWIAAHRPVDWVLAVLTRSALTSQDLLWRLGKVGDPEIEAGRQRLLEVLMEASPQAQRQAMDQGIEDGLTDSRLAATRVALRRVLARRQLAPSRDDDARIDACTDLAILERWLDRAFIAVRVSDVLG